MPPLLIVPCFVCECLAECPFWSRTRVGQTAGGEVFLLDVPLCVECEQRTRGWGEVEDEG